MKTTDVSITIDHFDGYYTWGIGDKGSFLNTQELCLRGVASGPNLIEELPALVNIETLNDIEPKTIEPDTDAVAVGKIEVKKTIQVYAVVACSGILYMLQLLNSGKKLDLIVTGGPLEQDGLGGQKADLLRLSLMATSELE